MGTDWDKLLIPGDAVSLATNCATSKPKMGYELSVLRDVKSSLICKP